MGCTRPNLHVRLYGHHAAVSLSYGAPNFSRTPVKTVAVTVPNMGEVSNFVAHMCILDLLLLRGQKNTTRSL
jgi:hypothetical protein